MLFMPEEALQLTVGNGENVFGSSGGRKPSDSGWIILLHYGGVTLFLLVLALILLATARLMKSGQIGLAMMFSSVFLLSNLKGLFFAPKPGLRFLILIYIYSIVANQSKKYITQRRLSPARISLKDENQKQLPPTNIVFLGGIYIGTTKQYVESMSIGNMQNAANVFQTNMILGLDEILDSPIDIVNLPFVGSYPRRFKSLYFPAKSEKIGRHSNVIGCGFLNATGIKFLSRFLSAVLGLLPQLNKRDTVILVYSAHLPFLIAALFSKILRRGVKICLVLPDLPEFMSENKGLRAFIKLIDARLFYQLVLKCDYLVTLTPQMIARVGFDERRALVIEGLVSSNEQDANHETPDLSQGTKYILYTGTLARRYGILDLIESVNYFSWTGVELWICGEGDAKNDILNAAQSNSSIKYLGQVNREDAIVLQRGAILLVNPRRPEGEYTKYSFPSKILEYMSSGRPIVMYKLDGIPEEYSPHYFSPLSVGSEGLGVAIRTALELGDETLKQFGAEAKRFVLEEKNAVAQMDRVLHLIKGQ